MNGEEPSEESEDSDGSGSDDDDEYEPKDDERVRGVKKEAAPTLGQPGW